MPKGLKGQKRSAAMIRNAVQVIRIATGGARQTPTMEERRAAAATLGRLGGFARAKKLSKKRRVEIAKTAAASRHKTSSK